MKLKAIPIFIHHRKLFDYQIYNTFFDKVDFSSGKKSSVWS